MFSIFSRSRQSVTTTSADVTMQPPSDPKELSDWVGNLAHQVEREDGLVHQRVTWMIQLEGFLFAGLALKERTPPIPLLVVMALVGITCACTTLLGVSAARRALNDLVVAFETIPEETRRHLVRPFGRRKDNSYGKITSAALPMVIVAAWLGLGFYCLANPPKDPETQPAAPSPSATPVPAEPPRASSAP
jgi:hypothetical protein